ncbi:MAG: SAM-dependent chlorinase/fluorinase, partial [Nitrospiraceae bacterium]|nr:SAM-dependent chlorinase/fluorinase [Nitrospiraceae bacterium]
MPGRPLITLTTDFGYDDPFVGVMKGVILKINPEVEIVDITHGIRPHDIQEAAFTIGMNYRYFPADTIHVVVVDPGVGSARRPLLVFSENHYFIGPDNGVFSYIYRVKHETLDVVHI